MSGRSIPDDHAHLSAAAQKLLVADEQTRIAAIRTDFWVAYPVAKKALADMRDLLDEPRNPRTRNLLLVGRSGNGKSSIVRRFVKENSRRIREDGQADFPVVAVDMPPDASETRFWSQVLRSLRVPFAESASPQRKMSQAFSVLEAVNCRAIIVDDVHNANVSNPRQVKQFLNVLKQSSTELQIPIIAVGIEDALNMLRSDRQLFSRFEQLLLPRWSLDKDWLSLLSAFEMSLPLANRSDLGSRTFAPLLLSKSNATIGGLAWILRKAAVASIRDGSERITPQAIERLGGQTAEDFSRAAAEL